MALDHDPQQNNPQSDEKSESLGRRQLLKMAAYVPPAMLGVMIAGTKMAEAAPRVGRTKHCGGGGMIVVSAGGNACCPCVPTSNQYNLNRCNLKRCQLGNCSSCSQVAFTSMRQCQQKIAQSGCACTCTPLQGGDRNRHGPATCI